MLYRVFSVGKEANESYTFKEMLQQDDQNQFVEAMTKEIGDHTKRKHWEIVLTSQMLEVSNQSWQYGPSRGSDTPMEH